MAEITPMRGKRSRGAHCPVEGHSNCEVVRERQENKPTRTEEKREFERDSWEEQTEDKDQEWSGDATHDSSMSEL